ncbi:transcriptional regulator [Photobacterium ganghwense]|uniref:ogr/Delta-like zinc finger family protein n=1 Tax=Photobacterium ganghwense TaxID=320778 RepID=UPI0009FEB2E1|nr:ogr/Delta-like zinc finger family protein [Photobacterium ganghwense]PSU07089.1 transcriptional regulator [Photobacterium ganghwense]QSV15845.1 ogr/Delta-like zinc finger family protein [Photobacterium ganghwense]
MRVLCKCGSRAIISRSEAVTDDCANLLCSCTDPECGHTFVSPLGYKHSLVQSKMSTAATVPHVNGSRVTCGCGDRAVITKTNRLTNDCADLYYLCKNPACGHRFVMSLYYSHSLSPSSRASEQLAVALVKTLSVKGAKQLREQLAMF